MPTRQIACLVVINCGCVVVVIVLRLPIVVERRRGNETTAVERFNDWEEASGAERL